MRVFLENPGVPSGPPRVFLDNSRVPSIVTCPLPGAPSPNRSTFQLPEPIVHLAVHFDVHFAVHFFGDPFVVLVASV